MKSRVTGVGWICVAMLTVAVLLWTAMASAVNLNGFWQQDYDTYSIFGNDTTHTYYRWNGTGQGWSHSNISTGNWCYLGNFLDKDASGWYMPGDGDWHNINANWAYRYIGGAGSWWTPTIEASMFSYNYDAGRWTHQGKYGGWQTLVSGGFSAAFMGDGAWHNLSATWAYNCSGGVGSWWTPSVGTSVFSYNYGTGQWSHEGHVGGWQTLGYAGTSAAFMGDGIWHNLSANWAYNYSGGVGSWWTPTIGASMFSYNYGTGQWSDQGKYGGWKTLGYAGTSAAFMGDGAWHNLSATWAYNYSGGVGSWWTPSVGTSVFSYNYGTGQWSHEGNVGGWQALGSGGASAAFMGDGAWHNLSAAWAYNYSGGVGSWWTPSVGTSVFSYNYGTGQWSDQGKYGGWQTLSVSGLNAAFVGDGGPHYIGQLYVGGPDWTYTYSTGGYGTWSLAGIGDRFLYQYTDGIWKFYETIGSGTWHELGQPGRTSQFIGDGSERDMGCIWKIIYTGSWNGSSWADTLTFKASDSELGGTWQEVLRYNWYTTPQWEDHDYGTAGTGTWYGAGSFKLASGGASLMNDTFLLETATTPNYSWHLYVGPTGIGTISTYFEDMNNYRHYRYSDRTWRYWNGTTWIDWGQGDPSLRRP